MFSNVGPFVLIWETFGVAVAGALRVASDAAGAEHLATAAAVSLIPALYATWELDRRILERAGREVSVGEIEETRGVARSPALSAGRQQRTA